MKSLARFCAAALAAFALSLVFTSARQTFAQATFSNAAPIEINDGTFAAPGNPYPSNINVNGLAGSVTKVTVTLNGFTHSFPTDVDLLLVGPNGQGVILMSDAGGSGAVAGMNVGFDDAAAANIPVDGPLDAGTYKPTDYDGFGSEEFPPSAPSGPYATTLAAFNGINPNGTWGLYVVDDQQGDAGQITGGWSLTVTVPSVPANPGDIIISEFRLRGPAGPEDEYVELFNKTATSLAINSVDGSDGWALVSSDGVRRFVVPNGTVIPAFGHFLAANSTGYGLSSYPGGKSRAATPDVSYTTDTPDGSGLALFRSTNAAAWTLENRMDAAGFGLVAALYREGTGLSPAGGVTENAEHAFVRSLATGAPADTNNNEADFWLVSTSAATLSGRVAFLGAPGPENLSSPTFSNNLSNLALVDTAAGSTANRLDDTTPSAIAPLGTISLRRGITNNQDRPITRLRFRITDLGTKNKRTTAQADLRVMSAPTLRVTRADGSVVTVLGTTVEQLPAQMAEGGGVNSTLNVPLDRPLNPGETVYFNLLIGYQTTGSLRFLVRAEIAH